MEAKYSSFTKVSGRSGLYKKGSKYYRLFAKGITPNGSWLIAPKMVHLKDINIATGKDIYGKSIQIAGGITGTVNASGKVYQRY